MTPRRGRALLPFLLVALAPAPDISAQTPSVQGTPTTITRLNLAPDVTTVTPARAQRGGAIVVSGTNLQYVTDVALVDARGSWPANVWSYNRSARTLRVTVPSLPVGAYSLRASNGWGADASVGTVQIYQEPISEPPDARQKLKSSLVKIVEEHRRLQWLSASEAAALSAKYNSGNFTDLVAALNEMQGVMRREAEAAVGGPVANNVLVLALKTGRPVREIALNWRHCHSLQVGIVEANVTSYRIGPPVREGQIFGPSCNGPNARWHSHVVPASISTAGQVATAIQTGGRPVSIPSHHHTEARFETGRIWYAPIEDDAWYSDLTDGAVYAFDWVQQHSDTIWAGAEILLIAYVAQIGCAAMVLSNGGAGCGPVIAWAAVEISKRVAVILVAEGVIEVPGVPKQALIMGINAIPVP
jgi:hypothetical protein